MGDMADLDDYYDPTLEQFEIQESTGKGWWMQANKKKIRISKMTDAHLANVIRLLQRRYSFGTKYDEMVVEAVKRFLKLNGV